jgi:predicted transcriptional regulator of viral defense system
MKYYKELLLLKCFSRSDVERLTGSAGAANALLTDYQKKNYIDSVKRNMYVALSPETEQAVASRYFIASHITECACLSHHAAFEYYGCANQVFNEVWVSGASRFAPFEYDDVIYRYIASRIEDGVVVKPDGIRVTDMERTVIDSLNDFEKIAGLEELLHCLELVPYMDEQKLLFYLAQYDKQILYQKTGYILNHLKKEQRLTERFFDTCEQRVRKSIRYLYHGVEKEPNTYDRRWQLFVPEDLMKMHSQGGEPNGDL